ncbi:hypothetical protein ACMCNP_05915 [Candidatus Acidulodesulfobacterium sp. H_13]|uniref:hypothetical protein n=1 Tax=Candidatus Acidulodesulfobacterium sp. H_13 TaxID=3395470 RepID=UPI003AF4F62A
MPKNIIYIEEYGIYQYFDGDKSVFSHDNPNETEYGGGVAAVAVISKNINFSVIYKKDIGRATKPGSNKYLGKYYGSKSYFVAFNGSKEYGIYHSLPSNIKKYYLLKGIDFVIPYDYLAILFLNFLNEKLNADKYGTFMFIEETENIYKITVITNGFSIFPVISFKGDMLNENLTLLIAKLNYKGVKIEKIFINGNDGDFNHNINALFPEAGIINFNTGDFFEFFDNMERQTPHFENPNVKLKELRIKKNRLNNIYMGVLIVFIIIMQFIILSVNKKIYTESRGINVLNSNIGHLSRQIKYERQKASFNEQFESPYILPYLKRLISIFPKGIKIKSLVITKVKNLYAVKGTALVFGGYRKFAKSYDMLLENASSLKNMHFSYDLDKFERPYIKFYGNIK